MLQALVGSRLSWAWQGLNDRILWRSIVGSLTFVNALLLLALVRDLLQLLLALVRDLLHVLLLALALTFHCVALNIQRAYVMGHCLLKTRFGGAWGAWRLTHVRMMYTLFFLWNWVTLPLALLRTVPPSLPK